MNVALIPARGGSKRIPHKNIKSFAGKPIIHYSIGAAKSSGLFERVIVSTDSESIAEVARAAGAETPFVRPAEFSNDFATTASVMLHGLQWMENAGMDVKYLCCIYATAPFVRASDLRKGYELVTSGKVDGAFSVTSFPFTPFRALKLGDAGKLEMIWPQYELTRSNDLPEAFHDAGQFYWVETGNFLKEQKVWPKRSMPVILPRYLVQDIDTLEDWENAEMKYFSLPKEKKA
jgi:pseudaminic acid cytidylyltransferase